MIIHCFDYAAEAVHGANPNVLVILSGLNFDTDLSFNGKLVFEEHWYSFGDTQSWTLGNPNQVCEQVTRNFMNQNKFLNCFMAVAAELDLDWASWTLFGGFYIREGVVAADQSFGILNWNWSKVRNSTPFSRYNNQINYFYTKSNVHTFFPYIQGREEYFILLYN